MHTSYPHHAIRLCNDSLDIWLSLKGGAIMSGQLKDGRPFLRETKPSADFKVTDQACFPMVPLCNRMGGNKFVFQNEIYHATANSPVGPLYIHGDAWLGDWDIESRTDHTVTMAFHHKANAGAPFSYSAKQSFTVDGGTLRITLSVTNTGSKALPFGFGFHPFFPRSDDMTLSFTSSGHWENDAENLPQTWTPSAGEMDFNTPSGLPKRLIDNCFMDWDGRAQIIWPNQDMALIIDADDIFKTCQVYAPQNQPFFCFEPMSHMSDGLSRAGYPGFKILASGATLSGGVDFHVKSGAYSAAR